MDQFMALKDKAQYDYVCCNFTDLEGNAVLTPYVIKELGGWKIAFVGVDTPETFTKSTPHLFPGRGRQLHLFLQWRQRRPGSVRHRAEVR